MFFVQKTLEQSFVYKNNKFNRVEDYTGVFYSYLTYKELDFSFLAGIRFSFIFKHLNILKNIQSKTYVNCISISEASDSIDIYLNLQHKNEADKVIQEEPQYCEILGGDFLFKSEIENLYCFVFEWLPGIKISASVDGVSPNTYLNN